MPGEGALTRTRKETKMQTVWKYEINSDDYVSLNLPLGAKPLEVQKQHGHVYLWCLVDPQQTIHEKRTFRLAGTGHPIKDNVDFIGTFQLDGGALVFHLFEVKE